MAGNVEWRMNKICVLRLNNSTGWEFLCSYLLNVEPQKCFMKIWNKRVYVIVDTHPVNYNEGKFTNIKTRKQTDLAGYIPRVKVLLKF